MNANPEVTYGDDALLLEIRKAMPEPGTVTADNWKAIKRPQLPEQDFRPGNTFRNVSRTIETEVFQKALISDNGTRFWAWKSSRDGKIYL